MGTLKRALLILNLVHEDGMFLTSRQIEAAHCNSFHEKRGTIMDQNISRQTNTAS
jgi:hypothetical protein